MTWQQAGQQLACKARSLVVGGLLQHDHLLHEYANPMLGGQVSRLQRMRVSSAATLSGTAAHPCLILAAVIASDDLSLCTCPTRIHMHVFHGCSRARLLSSSQARPGLLQNQRSYSTEHFVTFSKKSQQVALPFQLGVKVLTASTQHGTLFSQHGNPLWSDLSDDG